MATDIETLSVVLEAKAKDYERDMKRVVAQTEVNTRRIEREFAKANTSVANAMRSMQAEMNKGLRGPDMSGLFGGLAAGVVAKEIVGLADTWQSATNKIRATGLGDLDAKVAMDAIAGIADRARTDFGSTADLYARMSRAGQGFGASQAEVAVATEVVAKALKVAGASAQETESTLVQLGQALTSGRLQGDELRSLSENAPIVAQAVATAFGVSIGELKTLGAEGKLTSDRVFRAIVDAQPVIEKAFATTTATVADGFKRIETAATKFVGTSSTTNGAIAVISSALNGAANNFEAVAVGASALGAVLVSRLVAAGLTPVIAAFGATVTNGTAAGVAVGAAGTIASRSAVGFAAAGIAARGLGAGLMTIAGGPVGLMIFGLITVLGVFASKTTDAATTSKIYADALAQVERQSGTAAPAITAVGAAVEQAGRKMAAAKEQIAAKETGLTQFNGEARDLESTLRGLVAGIEQFGAVRVSNGEKEAALAAIKAAMEGDAQAALDAKAKIEELGGVNPSFAKAFSQFGAVLSALANIRAQAGAARAAIAGLSAEQDSVIAGRKARDDQNAVFKAGAPAIEAPGPNSLLAELNVERQVVLATMDETKKRVLEKRKELYDASLKTGGGLTIDAADAAARRIVAAEDAGKGGGRKGGGKAEKDDEFDRELEQHAKRMDALAREKEALGLSAFEAAKASESHRLLDAAKQAEIPVTDALRAGIERQAASYAVLKTNVDAAKQAQDDFKQVQQFLGTSLSGFFSDIVSGGKNASDALMNMTKKLADAAMQAVLLGQGPLASIFGTASGDKSSVGGIVGMLFGGFKGVSAPGLAVGTSNVPQDMLANIHKGEMVIPKYDADLLRSGRNSSGNSGAVSVSIDVRGATGNAEIQRMVAAGVAQGMASVKSDIGRNLPTMAHRADTRFVNG